MGCMPLSLRINGRATTGVPGFSFLIVSGPWSRTVPENSWPNTTRSWERAKPS